MHTCYRRSKTKNFLSIFWLCILNKIRTFFPTKSRYGMNRPATASLHSATPKKNVPCFSDMAVVKFFLKKERTFFFGVLPSRSRAGGGTMRTKFCKNYFLGKGFCKTSAHLFLNSDVTNGKGGLGEEFSICSSFCFGGIRGGQNTEKLNSISVLSRSFLC